MDGRQGVCDFSYIISCIKTLPKILFHKASICHFSMKDSTEALFLFLTSVFWPVSLFSTTNGG